VSDRILVVRRVWEGCDGAGLDLVLRVFTVRVAACAWSTGECDYRPDQLTDGAGLLLMSAVVARSC
jgi:hypothetical protein